MDTTNILQTIAIWILPVLFGITFHEAAHGWVANRLGDPTAKMLGRVSLNPLRHVDPFGTIIVPGIMLLLGPFLIGWAKPVPITWENFKKPKRDMILVALAGPFANLLMAIAWVFVARLGKSLHDQGINDGILLFMMGAAGIRFNLILMIFNLLPIPPLDGSRVISALLPGHMAWQYNRLEPYGFFIIIFLYAVGVLGLVLGPFIDIFRHLIINLFF